MAVDILVEIQAGAQSYDWGKLGKDGSKVSQFAKPLPGFEYDENKPYAELWMGTHPSLPSKLIPSNETLSSHLSSHPELLGDKVRAKYGDDLPYLFKVLAIRKALSIQAHPDKELARRLHKERPDVYKDPNHKPEMAIALTPFSGFCGFRPLKEISFHLETVPEFAALFPQPLVSSFLSTVCFVTPSVASKAGEDVKDEDKEGVDKCRTKLRELFKSLMEADPEQVVKPNLRKLVARYKKEAGVSDSGSSKDMKKGGVEELVVRLDEQFQDDVGAFCTFVLNIVQLEPGQAVFLKANEPHAYLEGDIMECMATSDNVVRAGLTPKLRDVPTLISMLTYTYGPSSTQLMSPLPFKSTKHTTLYDPPIDEFSVLLVVLEDGQEEVHPAVQGPSVIIVTELEKGEGQGAELEVVGDGGVRQQIKREGQVYFLGAGAELKIKSGKGKTVVYRAFVETD